MGNVSAVMQQWTADPLGKFTSSLKLLKGPDMASAGPMCMGNASGAESSSFGDSGVIGVGE